VPRRDGAVNSLAGGQSLLRLAPTPGSCNPWRKVAQQAPDLVRPTPVDRGDGGAGGAEGAGGAPSASGAPFD